MHWRPHACMGESIHPRIVATTRLLIIFTLCTLRRAPNYMAHRVGENGGYTRYCVLALRRFAPLHFPAPALRRFVSLHFPA